MTNKKFDIVNIDLGLDLNAEIRDKANALSRDIKIYTNGLANRAELKRQTPNKKQVVQAQWDEKMQAALKLLTDARDTDDPWVKADALLVAAGMEQLSPMIARLKTFLRRDDVWVLMKTKRHGETVYSVQKFGKAD